MTLKATAGWILSLTLLGVLLYERASLGDEPPLQPVKELTFVDDVAPFLKTHCYDCHGKTDPEAGLSLEKYRQSSNIQTDFEVWEKVQRMIAERQMPPKDAEKPAEAEIQAVLKALTQELGRYDCGQAKRPGWSELE
jgi:hypothetical protein